MDYNALVRAFSSFECKRLIFASFLALSTAALAGASCKKSSATPEDNGAVAALDKVEGTATPGKADEPAAKPAEPADPASYEPVAGVDIEGLDDKKKTRFHNLVSQLASPCGKAHSLRTSVAEDGECKRAVHAARYVAALLGDEAEDREVRELYDLRYRDPKVHSFALDATVPHEGAADAPVKLVEFYDYGCAGCKSFKPVLEAAMKQAGSDAVIFYKQFPLSHIHPNSKGAAQAALAAAKQGKFEQMHDLLFQRSPQHTKKDLTEYAKQLGLNMAKFEADFIAAGAKVDAEVAEGDAADVHGTPALFINGKAYQGPSHPRYIKMWIEEELAVNR